MSSPEETKSLLTVVLGVVQMYCTTKHRDLVEYLNIPPFLLPRRLHTQGLISRKKEKHKAEPQVLHIRHHPAIIHYHNKPTARKHADNLGRVSKADDFPNPKLRISHAHQNCPPPQPPSFMPNDTNSLPLPPTPLNSPHPLQQPQIPPAPDRRPPPPLPFLPTHSQPITILLPKRRRRRRRRRQPLQTKNNAPHRSRTRLPDTILLGVHNTPRNADRNGEADRHGLSLHHHDWFFCIGFGTAVPTSTGTGEE